MRALALASLVCLTAPAAADDSLRCGADLVTVGASEAEVATRCGPPTTVTTQRATRRFRGAVAAAVFAAWTYDRGPHEFVRTLRFWNGVLTDVDVGGYGH